MCVDVLSGFFYYGSYSAIQKYMIVDIQSTLLNPNWDGDSLQVLKYYKKLSFKFFPNPESFEDGIRRTTNCILSGYPSNLVLIVYSKSSGSPHILVNSSWRKKDIIESNTYIKMYGLPEL